MTNKRSFTVDENVNGRLFTLEEMYMSNRKEEILIVALHLFARDGYEAFSVSQIAGELDMTKGALYRHYKRKRDIFDCIVQRMEQQDGEQAAEYDMPEEDKEKMPEKYETVLLYDFAEYSKGHIWLLHFSFMLLRR